MMQWQAAPLLVTIGALQLRAKDKRHRWEAMLEESRHAMWSPMGEIDERAKGVFE